MADISQELARILSAVYGEEVRGSIHDAIEKINDVSEVVLSTGTAVTSSSSSSEGYYVDSLYLNTDEMELWKCMGTNSWQSQGFFKGDKGDTGDDGVGITSITKTSTSGLVDTYTISYTDSTTSTFTVTNGADGEDGKGIVSITKTSTAGLVDTYTILYTDNTTTTFEVHNGRVGNKWYTGHIIEGKSVNPTVFSSSGISYAYEGDMYLNTTEGAVYHCSREGDPLVATWVYDFTIQGAGSGATVMSDLQDVDINTILDGQVLQYDSANSDWKNRTIIDNIVENSTKAAQSGAVYTALAGKQDTLTEGTGIDITSNVVSIDADSTPTSESNKPVTSGGVYTALSNKQDTLTFDNVPTQNSDNPVKSGGVYSSLDEFTAAETQSGTTVTFSGLNPSYGYQLFWDDASASGDLAIPKPININKTIDSGTGLMTLVYTIKGGTSGSSQFKLRILK